MLFDLNDINAKNAYILIVVNKWFINIVINNEFFIKLIMVDLNKKIIKKC